MYVVLANKATKTIEWIGCEQAGLEMDWSTGVICLLIQFGFDEVELVSEVRNRAGRKEAPSMIAEGLRGRGSWPTSLYLESVGSLSFDRHGHWIEV